MTRRTFFATVAAQATASADEIQPLSTLFRVGKLLHNDDFSQGLDQWIPELEKPGTVEARDGKMNVDVPAGCTVWFKPELKGSLLIQYDATMIKAEGPHDRVSDLNCFWMATDSRSPESLFATSRSGKFADYDKLRTYYVGQGGNRNTTTRFRRYIGAQDLRPLLPEHDLNETRFLLRPNVRQTLDLVAFGGRIQYYRDRSLIFDYTDAEPYTHGHFGFRTTASHVELRSFRIHALLPA